MFNSNRISLSESDDKLVISTTSRKNWWYNLSLIFMQVFMTIPNATLIFVTIHLIPEHELAGFIIFGFTLAFFSIYVWFWKVLIWFVGGKEIVTITEGTLKIQKKRAIGHPPKLYRIQDVLDLRIANEPYSDITYTRFFDTTLAIKNGGRIKFDYGMRTIRFGYLIDNEDAEKVLKLVKERINKQSA